jgi:hypothetical protein
MNYIKVRNESDMLKGNINRMCITDDIEEINRMYEVAKNRLRIIYQENVDRISE